MEVTIGGERLGNGNKSKVWLREYERSNQDLGYTWRSTMACGTIVPFMCEIMLPADTFDIDLEAVGLTHPTIGPLFGHIKMELAVFVTPVRKFQGELHLNQQGVGLDMSKIKLPYVELEADDLDKERNLDNQQINPSCIFNYLGIRGIGHREIPSTTPMRRQFTALQYLNYWAIYKQYYANKQEEIGVVIHKSVESTALVITSATIGGANPNITIPLILVDPIVYTYTKLTWNSLLTVELTGLTATYDPSQIQMYVADAIGVQRIVKITDIFRDVLVDVTAGEVRAINPHQQYQNINYGIGFIEAIVYIGQDGNDDIEPQLVTFPLKNIDDMHKNILRWPNDGIGVPINSFFLTPYSYPLEQIGVPGEGYVYSKQFSQEGLAIKTYQSDLFNNWINTDWIDGVDGISQLTAVDVSGGSLILDELVLKEKVYNMLNRIAISGGSYYDWQRAVYGQHNTAGNEEPAFVGGLIKNIIFDEVISTAETQASFTEGAGGAPLGTLAGRGNMGSKHKGGKIVIKAEEMSIVTGVITLTPYIDYSQGNSWQNNLMTMDDFHKPQMDEIGFQPLITDQMAFWDTQCDEANNKIYRSAGKQPAWVNYMTNVNKVYGNFADQTQQMFMVLNRRYEPNTEGAGITIKDLTTYIDPVKYNQIFADTRRDAQNFWVQIKVGNTARRKMSGKLMPNL